MTAAEPQNWKPSACILCSINCPIEVQVTDGKIGKIRGDAQAATSEGYLCQKAARLQHYQYHQMRLTKPLRRRADGSFEEVDWDTAINEIAAKMQAIKSAHGGHAFAYYGGGGQGNHLGGVYSAALRSALDTPYIYTALAQEKTGDFWVNGKLFGRQSCFVGEGMEHSDYAIVLGANPWQAHGFPRSRDVLKEFQKDSNRTLVVIDPRVSDTAKMADIHLQVKPGMDAFLLSAILAVILQEGLENKEFIARHTTGFEQIAPLFCHLDIADYAARSGVPEEQIRSVARGFARAKAGTVRADLGIQQSLHSTLNSWLEKLLFLVCGHFGKAGSNHLIAQFAPLIGHSNEDDPRTKVTGMQPISKLYPPNILPLEIDTDHPDRLRALIVDSANPALSAADGEAYRRAFAKLELMVVIDVAMTETARQAHYVLPAPSQFEKAEATFFTHGFPTPYFHLRKPILLPTGDTLPEPEIYRRLCVSLGVIPDRFPLLENVARLDRRFQFSRAFPLALATTLKANPQWLPSVPLILYATLGKALPDGLASAAALWGVTQFFVARYGRAVRRRAIGGKGYSQGNALFNRIIESDRPVALASFTWDESLKFIKTPDKKIRLHIPELAQWLSNLADEKSLVDDQHPFILVAGERRAYNANQIYRDPSWRKTDREGSLRIHPLDLEQLGVSDGGQVRLHSKRGSIEVEVAADEGMQRGVVTLPHGYGMWYEDAQGQLRRNGPAINELTAGDHCDPIAKTPFHKYVPVAIERI